MGENYDGQLGIRKNIGIILDEFVLEPTPIVEEEGILKGKKIVDFDVGGNSLLILTGFSLLLSSINYVYLYLFFIFISICIFLEDNQVFFSGLNLICKPSHWILPNDVKVKKLLASYETFGVLSSIFVIKTLKIIICLSL